jgi:hypothetical protein
MEFSALKKLLDRVLSARDIRLHDGKPVMRCQHPAHWQSCIQCDGWVDPSLNFDMTYKGDALKLVMDKPYLLAFDSLYWSTTMYPKVTRALKKPAIPLYAHLASNSAEVKSKSHPVGLVVCYLRDPCCWRRSPHEYGCGTEGCEMRYWFAYHRILYLPHPRFGFDHTIRVWLHVQTHRMNMPLSAEDSECVACSSAPDDPPCDE